MKSFSHVFRPRPPDLCRELAQLGEECSYCFMFCLPKTVSTQSPWSGRLQKLFIY